MMTQTRNVCLLALFSVAIASPALKAKLEAIESPVDELHIKATIPHYNFEDVLLLKPHYLNEKERQAKITDCKFIGTLASNPKASVGLNGCLGQDGVSVTILSSEPHLYKSFTLSADGTMEEKPLAVSITNNKTITIVNQIVNFTDCRQG